MTGGKAPEVKAVVYVDANGGPKSPVALMREWQDAATVALAEWQSAANGAITNRQSIIGKERERKIREVTLRAQVEDVERAQVEQAEGKRVTGLNQDWRDRQFLILCTNDEEHIGLTAELELLRGSAQLAESSAEQARERARLYQTLLQTLGALHGWF